MSTTTTRPAPAGAAPAPKGTPPARSINLNAILVEGRALIALILIIAIFAVLSDNYLSTGNLTTITKQVAFNAIVALGMLLVILNGGIDLSVGSTVGLTGAVAGNLFRGVHVPLHRHDDVPERLGHRGHLHRHRHARRTGQRVTDSEAEPGAVHRDPGHALRGPRPHRGPAQRPEHHQRVERSGGSRQHRILRGLRQPPPGSADLGLGDDPVRHRDVDPADPDAVRSLAVRHRQQRAGRPALGCPGQERSDPDLRHLRPLRRCRRHPPGRQHQLLDRRPGHLLRAERHRRGGHRRRRTLRRPRHRARHDHRRLRDRVPGQRSGHRRRLAVLAEGDHRSRHHPRGRGRPDPADRPAAAAGPPGHDQCPRSGRNQGCGRNTPASSPPS